MSSKLNFSSIIKKGKRIARRCSSIYRKILMVECMDDYRFVFRSVPNIVSPGVVSPMNEVPDHIVKPYYLTENVKPPAASPTIKSAQDLVAMKSTCQLAKGILFLAEKFIKVGVTTDELDKYIHKAIIKHSAYPSPLMYYGFPKSICTSVNNIACHGIPDDRKLENGDIITVDVTVFRDGFHGDCAATFLVGNVSPEGKKLVSAAERILNQAISRCAPGRPFSTIAEVITEEANLYEYSVIPSICGHGIGTDFHEYPEIMHSIYYVEDHSAVMVPGMTFTIEPVISEFGEDVYMLDDNWTLASAKDSLCAQFEHTVLITDNGVEVLT